MDVEEPGRVRRCLFSGFYQLYDFLLLVRLEFWTATTNTGDTGNVFLLPVPEARGGYKIALISTPTTSGPKYIPPGRTVRPINRVIDQSGFCRVILHVIELFPGFNFGKHIKHIKNILLLLPHGAAQVNPVPISTQYSPVQSFQFH